jgi:hypothetical protein
MFIFEYQMSCLKKKHFLISNLSADNRHHSIFNKLMKINFHAARYFYLFGENILPCFGTFSLIW